MADSSKTTLYLYDLPKESITSVSIHKAVKDITGYDLPEMPQIRRDIYKPFYTAMIRIQDPNNFNEIRRKLKYFQITVPKKGSSETEQVDCRALPYLKELTAAHRSQNNKTNNIFVKGLSESMTTQQLDEAVKRILGEDHIVSAKVSINPDRKSRQYGFVCFDAPDFASHILSLSDSGKIPEFQAFPFNPKDRREARRVFNNIYVKDFPENWTEENLRNLFGKYGEIKSLIMMAAPKPGTNEQSKFAFVCYERPGDKEYGPQCAAKAVEQEHEKEYDGKKIYVQEAMPKTLRQQQKLREQTRYKKSKQRCNLYVKNFPPQTTEEELHAYFSRFGEIESVKLNRKDGQALYAFVCYKQPDSASFAKQQVMNFPLNGQHLFVNFYELKEVRTIQQEQQRDQADFQQLKKQQPMQGIDMNLLNRPDVIQMLQNIFLLASKNMPQQNRGNNMYRNNQQPRNNNNNMRPQGQPGYQQNQGGRPVQPPAPQMMPPQQPMVMPPQMMPMNPQNLPMGAPGLPVLTPQAIAYN